ncbi:MAG TPA: amidohydrolase family protein [Acidimicrobiales bacterium]|nr:amidohydrolase family protein [Acidimicrobiales bacterium]
MMAAGTAANERADHDLVVRGATVYDGTGAPPSEVDVACSAGRLSAVGRDVGRGREELDGRGLVLAPGFIDPHTHLDANLFWDPDLTPSSSFGVTTVVMTNCGYGLAPVDGTTRDYVLATMSQVEQIPRRSLEAGVPWDWTDLPSYLARLDRTPSLLNFALLCGHVPLRAAVLGPDGASARPATPAEQTHLGALVREALELGCLGFSTDQVVENYGAGGVPLPGQVCDDEELLAVAGALGHGPGPGLFTMAPRQLLADRPARHRDLEWHRRLARRSGRPVVVGPVFELWHDPGGAVELIEAALAANGPGRVVPQISTRPFELWTRLDEAGLLVQSLPTLRRAVRAGGADGVAALAGDEERRARLRDEGGHLPETPVFSGRWEHVRVRYSTHPEAVGRRVDELAAESGTSPTDVLLDLALADGFETQVATAMANSDDAAIADQLRLDGVMIGASDAGAHVLSNTDSCYAVWTLQHWVREEGVLSLGRALRMLTADQADLLGLADRGRIAEGLAADLVLFDPDRIGVRRVRYVADQPAGGKRLVSEAQGVVASVVNGVVATREGEPTGARPGRRLRPAGV